MLCRNLLRLKWLLYQGVAAKEVIFDFSWLELAGKVFTLL